MSISELRRQTLRRAAHRLYRKRNPDKVALYQSNWRKRNPEKVRNKRVLIANWRKRNPDKVAAYRATSKKRNPGKESAQGAKWRKNNPEKVIAPTIELHDCYIRSLLRSSRMPRMGGTFIPPELIQLKREQIRLYRAVKQRKGQ